MKPNYCFYFRGSELTDVSILRELKKVEVLSLRYGFRNKVLSNLFTLDID